MYLVRCRKSKHQGSGLSRCYKNFSSLILLLGALFFVGVSCSDDSSTGMDSDFPDDPGFDAELGEDTSLMPEHISEAGLIESDEEDHTYTFNAEILNDADFVLEEGKILLIENKALRRIADVNETNDEIIVETEYATLNEAFKNAEVDWNETINFTESIAEDMMLEIDGELVKPKRNRDNGTLSWEYELDDFKLEAKMATSPDEVGISMLLSYDIDHASGAMSATTTIQQIDTESGFEIIEHETDSFYFNNPNLAGELDMEFVLAGGNSDTFQWSPPFPAIIIPFTVGPIPVQFRLGTVFLTEFSLGEVGFAEYKTSFSYDASAGFSADGSGISPILEGFNESVFREGEGNAGATTGSASAQWGIAVPEVSLRIFDEAVVPFLRPEFYTGGGWQFPDCLNLYSRLELKAGVNMNLFGLAKLNTSEAISEFWSDEYYSDSCNGKWNSESNSITALNYPDQFLKERRPPFKIH